MNRPSPHAEELIRALRAARTRIRTHGGERIYVLRLGDATRVVLDHVAELHDYTEALERQHTPKELQSDDH